MNPVRPIKKFCILFRVLAITGLLVTGAQAEMRDPTEPVMSSNSTSGEYELQSILIGPMRQLVMINGQLVGTGSSIQGARVLAIAKNYVILFYAGKKRKLYLFEKRLWKAH